MARTVRDEVWGQATTFAIEEVLPGGTGQWLWLSGRALPKPPFELGGSLRADFTWYAGSNTATVQVLGTEESTTTISGVWSTRFLGEPDMDYATYEGNTLKTARDLAKAMETIARRGQLLEVTWDVQVRWGFITSWKFSWTRAEDVEWEVEFTWASAFSRDPPKVNVASSDTSSKVATAKAAVGAAMAAVGSPPFQPQAGGGVGASATASIPDQDLQSYVSNALAYAGNVAESVTGPMSQGMEQLRAAVRVAQFGINGVQGLVTGVLDTTSGLATAPGDAFKTLATSFNSAGQAMKASYEGAVETLSQTFLGPASTSSPGGSQSAAGPTAGIQTSSTPPTVSQRAAAQTATFDTLKTVRTSARTLLVQAREVAAQSPQETFTAIYTARDGDDLRVVSTLYYGTPDLWISIAKANSLLDSALVAGQQVFIPAVPLNLSGPAGGFSAAQVPATNSGSSK